jgi:DNA-binding transcriptional LysR family regulator
MNDKQLASFIASFETGSFRKAAQGTYLTVPSLIKRVDSLENELGYRLFLRSPNGIEPTDAGIRFYNHAKEILTMMAVAKERDDDRAGISVGIWWRAPNCVLEATRQFSKKHPDVVIEFIETDWERFPADLHNGKIDLFVGNESSRAKDYGLLFEKCRNQSFYGVFSPQSELCKQELLDTRAIENYIIYAGADWRDVPGICFEIEALFRRDNVVKKPIFAEKLIADCLQDKAIALFFEDVSLSMLPSLEARPLDWPTIAGGITFRNNPSTILREYINTCKTLFSKSGTCW